MIRSFNGKTPQIHPSAFISEAAYIVGDVEIGEGSSIWPGAVIRADTGKVVIGRNTAVEDACVIHGKRIGNNVMVGINATVLHQVEIGNFCIIAAGCLVSQDMKVPDNSYVVGIPGRIKGPVPEKLRFWLDQVPLDYVDLARQYKEEGLS